MEMLPSQVVIVLELSELLLKLLLARPFKELPVLRIMVQVLKRLDSRRFLVHQRLVMLPSLDLFLDILTDICKYTLKRDGSVISNKEINSQVKLTEVEMLK